MHAMLVGWYSLTSTNQISQSCPSPGDPFFPRQRVSKTESSFCSENSSVFHVVTVIGTKVKVSLKGYGQNRQRSAHGDHKDFSTRSAISDALIDPSSMCKN
jgi:hypothetical protein